MKKLNTLILIVALLLVTGCVTPQATPVAEEAQPADVAAVEPAAEAGTLLVAYSQAELVNAWRVTNQADMEAQAATFGVDLISADANQDPSKQLADVENMLAQQPDCLIVSPLESKASAPVVKMAEDAGVPLFIIDRTIEATPGKGMYITEITQSHVLSGKLLAEMTVQLLTENTASQGQRRACPGSGRGVASYRCQRRLGRGHGRLPEHPGGCHS